MELTPKQVKNFIIWLESRWGRDKKCPMCNHDSWHVADRLFQLNTYGFESRFPSPVQPVAPVICNNCGYTVYVNAITANLVPPEGGS
jgi:hypothetical protein